MLFSMSNYKLRLGVKHLMRHFDNIVRVGLLVGSAPEKRIIRTNYKRQFSDKPSPGRTM
jgi:hypothetical protein